MFTPQSVVSAFPATCFLRIFHLVPCIALSADEDVLEDSVLRYVKSLSHFDHFIFVKNKMNQINIKR